MRCGRGVGLVTIEAGQTWQHRTNAERVATIVAVRPHGGRGRVVQFAIAGVDGWRTCSAGAFIGACKRVDAATAAVPC